MHISHIMQAKRAALYAVTLSMGILAMASVNGRAENNPAPNQIAQLHWLEGTWRGMLGENTFEATYTSPEGGQILSISKELLPDGSAFVEFERFHTVDSFVVMTPYPGGRESVPFTMTALGDEDQQARFSNPDHDFPNDIIYTAFGRDSLHIEVTGLDDNGRRQGFTVKLERVR